MKYVWQPLIPLRFKTDPVTGQKILQQCWGKAVLRENGWAQTCEHEWRNVPLDPSDSFFAQEVIND